MSSAPAAPTTAAAAATAPHHGLPALLATLVAMHACMAVTRVAASLWVLHQGLGDWALGLLLSLFAVAPIVLSLWAGRQADRHGFHRPVGIGVLLGLAGALLALLALLNADGQSFWMLGAGCVACGGAIALTTVAVQREAGQMASEPVQLKRVFSWIGLAPAVSSAATPVVAGLLIDHLGYFAAFALAAVLPLLAWLLALRVPRHPPRASTQTAAAVPAWHLLRLPELRRILIVNIVLSASWDSHSFVVPVIGHAKALSASSIGLVLGTFSTAATLVRLAIARWGAELDELKSLRAATVLAIVLQCVYYWLPGTPGLVLGSALLGVALGSVQPMVLAMLAQVAPPEQRGQVLGLRMVAVYASTLLMPTGFGLLATATVGAAPMWLMAALLLVVQIPLRNMGNAGPQA